MSTPTFVSIPKVIHESIARWAEKSYPHEGCGLLIGRFAKGGEKEAVRLATLENILLKAKTEVADKNAQDSRLSTLPPERHNRPEVGFAFDPGEYNKVVMAAERENLDVIGVVHTHPDHPPRPSKIDESQPFLAQFSNIIVAVEKGHTREMKSWFRETDGIPFSEEDIRVTI